MIPSPAHILTLSKNEVFVFGSNEAGIHGAGAAKAAIGFGAKYGIGFGMQGKSFAIPTKNWNIETLSLQIIGFYIHRFISFSIFNPQFTYMVTEVGCGLAGYKPIQIAPFFSGCPDNVHLPQSFINILNNYK